MLNECKHTEIAHYDLAGGDHGLCRQCGKMLTINGVPVEELILRQIDGEELLLSPAMELASIREMNLVVQPDGFEKYMSKDNDEHFARVGGFEVIATTTGLVINRIEDEAGELKIDAKLDKDGPMMLSNFSMYIDGYTMRPNDECTIEGQAEILCTAPDGRTCVIKTGALTAFIERRINE